jgi:hypothetical protein
MKILHRIAFSARPNLESRLESLGVSLEKSPLPGGHYLVLFDINELDPIWLQVEPVIRYEPKSDIWETSFEREEILSAEWNRLRVTYEQGYPQPEQTWAFEPVNLSQKCPKCGAGYTQNAPYRISKEPRMGKNDFVTLYWTNTVLGKKQVISQLHEHDMRGYDIWDVILHRTGIPSGVVSQILPVQITSDGLSHENKLKSVTCDYCGITKFAYHSKGYMHYARDAIRDDVDILYTSEWFGSGGTAFHEILISNRFVRYALDGGWKGIALKPIKLV